MAVSSTTGSTPTRQHVSAEVRAWAARRGMTQARISTIVGLSQGQVSQRFNGRLPWSLDELDVLADAFGIETIDFFAPPRPRRGGGLNSDWRLRGSRKPIIPAARRRLPHLGVVRSPELAPVPAHAA